MKRIEVICCPDGSALYVNGKLISDRFTCGQAALLEACDVKIHHTYLVYKLIHKDFPDQLSDAKRIFKIKKYEARTKRKNEIKMHD